MLARPLVIAGIATIALSPPAKGGGFGPDQVVSFQDLWPNLTVDGQFFLDASPPHEPSPTAAVFWFDHPDGSTFHASNSRPFGRCNQDVFRLAADGAILYAETRSVCSGAARDLQFDPPLLFFPGDWDPATAPWRKIARSEGRFHVSGQLEGEANVGYVSEIIGWEVGELGEDLLHWRTRQTLLWYSGPLGGTTTRWQEDWWFGLLPVEGGGWQPGLQRTMGGNLDLDWPGWDIRFAGWARLERANHAEPVSHTIPPTMIPGIHYPVQITMRNTGNATWTAARAYYLVGSASWRGPGLPPWNLPYGALGWAEAVAPGASTTFLLDLVAPPIPGVYELSWRMQELMDPFGQGTLPVAVRVATGVQRPVGSRWVASGVHPRQGPLAGSLPGVSGDP